MSFRRRRCRPLFDGLSGEGLSLGKDICEAWTCVLVLLQLVRGPRECTRYGIWYVEVLPRTYEAVVVGDRSR